MSDERPEFGRKRTPRRRFAEEQIITVLREAQAGAKVAELLRKHGISEATCYNRRARYGGMTVSEGKRLKELEAGNAKLMKLLAEAELVRRLAAEKRRYGYRRLHVGLVREGHAVNRKRTYRAVP